MKAFQLHRDVDSSGVSGTGIVAEGVQFTTGKVAMLWLTPHPSVNVYDNIEDLIHNHGHGGNTRVVWIEHVTIRKGPPPIPHVPIPAVPPKRASKRPPRP